MKLILGSSSPARKALLQQLQIPFSIAHPNIDESAQPGEGMEALVARLSLAKAQTVANQHPNSWVIGCDQLVCVNNEILGKPGTIEKAKQQLQLCSGKKLQSLTAMTIIRATDQLTTTDIVPYSVFFKQLSAELIDFYIKLDNPLHCAGSIKAESAGSILFERLQGDDPTALTGLPLIRLYDRLIEMGFKHQIT